MTYNEFNTIATQLGDGARVDVTMIDNDGHYVIKFLDVVLSKVENGWDIAQSDKDGYWLSM